MGKPEGNIASPSLVVGRELRSTKYGKGFIAEIEGDAIRVRFWKRGYKTFQKPEAAYPFELLDEVRPVKKQSTVEKVLARETRTEKNKRALCCPHKENRSLCVKCAELPESEIKKWNPQRTTERRINPRGVSLGRYRHVRISSNDRVVVSRAENTVPVKEISLWYRCARCEDITRVPASKAKLTLCPRCGGPVTSIPEPFQSTQFSPHIGNGALAKTYRATATPARIRHTEEEEIQDAILIDLFTDPRSGFQRGGTGYLRIPLDAPRSTRADAPEWLDRRESFLVTLRRSRSERAERILCGFYVAAMTDEQIAKMEGWTKDAIKEERQHLAKRGNHFFRTLALKHPPSPATSEGGRRIDRTPQLLWADQSTSPS
jgi:hypothetical protein